MYLAGHIRKPSEPNSSLKPRHPVIIMYQQRKQSPYHDQADTRKEANAPM